VSEELSRIEIAERLAAVRARIDEEAAKAGRAGAVRLIAVTKGKPAEAVRLAYEAGQRHFGENYAQELTQKAEALRDLPGLVWHFIGRLQRNKARQVAREVTAVHTVDRVELAVELGKRTAAHRPPLDVLVEVNVSGELSKGGCAPADLGALLDAVRAAPRLRAVGLMTVPPDVDDAEAARPTFAALRALRDEHGGASVLPELSMGMTHDFPVAIAEGATFVRVGTAIFGARAPRVA
jgi:hypothetical protein